MKLRPVYQAIVALSKEGVCDANQRQIMQLAGVSRRHLQRILQELDELGLIRTERYRNFRLGKTKNRYFILGQPNSRNPVAPGVMGHIESHHPPSDGPYRVPSGRVMGHIESHHRVMGLLESPMHDSCMLHGEIERKNWFLLDFLNEPERSHRATACSLELVQAWRDLKEFRDQNELWTGLGFTNPAGWINNQLKDQKWPPPLQMPLPGGSLDLSDFQSRGQTRQEIESQHPAAQTGFTLGEDGLWR